ncbi:MAG: AsmA-like C-terminal region-containing protein [Bacteroidota bacterium]
MKKKVLKISGIFLLLFIAILIAVPLFLEGKISDIIKNKVNENINATLDFEKASLSLFKDFPNVNVKLMTISLVNKAPFAGDTLFASGSVGLTMSITELFKGTDAPIAIKSLNVANAKIHIKVDEAANANYDITNESEPTATDDVSEGSNSFTLELENYAITNTEIVYDDLASGMHLTISEMNHSGTGDLSLETSKLQTKTEALVSFDMDSTRYLNKNKIALDALIGIDLKENKYSFLENRALINQLPLVFDGFVKINETDQEVAITFQTPSSDFKNFLAVIPETYSKNIANVETKGNFEIDGQFEGIVDEEHIPQFYVKVNAENASFQYPDLPKAVKNIAIDTEIKNETGIVEDTYINIKKLSFQIDDDRFNVRSMIRDVMGNTKVNADINGRVNLANISKAYPIAATYTGILDVDVSTAFDMAAIEQERYADTQSQGTINVTGFAYTSAAMNNPIQLHEAAVTFNPETVSLNSFDGETGQTDFNATGTLTNLLGFVFNDENIEGNFNLSSNTFDLNDFMVEENGSEKTERDENTTNESEKIKIPAFLDCTIDATANTVHYDNLTLKSVSGRLKIKDETATLENLTSSIFDGKLSLNGKVSTKNEAPAFDMDMGMSGFKIGESFQALGLFKAVAPVAGALQGTLNSDIQLSGNLKDDLTPNLTSLSGDVLAELLSTKVNTENAPLLTALDGKLNFIDLEAIDLSGLKTALSFDNGAVQVQPFTLSYQDIDIKVAGNHTFDRELQYSATLNVPAKYLGKEVTNLMAQIDDASLEDLTIPVVANIGGSYTSPTITTDLTSGVSNLTTQLVEIQKQKLVNKGKDEAKNLISGFLGESQDSTQTNTSTGVTEAIGGLLGTEKQDTKANTDTTTTEKDAVKDAAKNILGGLLGRKKKKDSVEN